MLSLFSKIAKIKKALNSMLSANKKMNIIKNEVNSIERKIDMMRLALGRIENRTTQLCADNNKGMGGGYEFQIFSQWGEDGIIQYLIHNITIARPVFIEFGTQNYTESNTRFLLVNNNWSGLIVDGNKDDIDFVRKDEIYWKYNIKAVQHFITAENINDIFLENGLSGDIGLLSIDIDGNDYWVWKAITAVRPDIVICEYNPRFGKERAVTIPYDPEWTRFKVHYSGIYFGASIKALVLLGESKGYSLVAGTMCGGSNLFFVRNELLNNAVKARTVDEVFVKNQYQDSRDPDGSLRRISDEEEKDIIESLPVIEVN